MAIEKDLLDQLLAGRDPKDVFNKDGLVDELIERTRQMVTLRHCRHRQDGRGTNFPPRWRDPPATDRTVDARNHELRCGVSSRRRYRCDRLSRTALSKRRAYWRQGQFDPTPKLDRPVGSLAASRSAFAQEVGSENSVDPSQRVQT